MVIQIQTLVNPNMQSPPKAHLVHTETLPSTSVPNIDKDIDFEHHVIHVRHAIHYESNQPILGDPKLKQVNAKYRCSPSWRMNCAACTASLLLHAKAAA